MFHSPLKPMVIFCLLILSVSIIAQSTTSTSKTKSSLVVPPPPPPPPPLPPPPPPPPSISVLTKAVKVYVEDISKDIQVIDQNPPQHLTTWAMMSTNSKTIYTSFMYLVVEVTRQNVTIDSVLLAYDHLSPLLKKIAQTPDIENSTIQTYTKNMEQVINLLRLFKREKKAYTERMAKRVKDIKIYNNKYYPNRAENIKADKEYKEQLKEYQEQLKKYRKEFICFHDSRIDNSDHPIDNSDHSICTDCSSVYSEYGPKFKANPNDLQTAKILYRKLKKLGCQTDPLYLEALTRIVEAEPTGPRLRSLAGTYQKQKNFDKTIQLYEKSTTVETDPAKNAKVYYRLAQIAFAKGQKSKARKHAHNAAKMKPGWGDPYILIGDMYASTKWKDGMGGGSVFWVAVDMYIKAKAIDLAVASKAKSRINKYSRYFPDSANILKEKNISAGATYRVGDWIQENTVVR